MGVDTKDKIVVITALRDKAFATAKAHGWHDKDWSHGTGTDVTLALSHIALMHSELGEATEAIRKGNWCKLNPLDPRQVPDREAFEKLVKDTVEDELADTVIRILDFCGANKVDIASHIIAKMDFNEGREYRHGGKLA